MLKKIKAHPKLSFYGFLLGLLAVSFFLRVYGLAGFPPGLHFDEAVAGYNAYSILETGTTVRNGSWPLYLDTFGDFRPMGIVYMMLPSIAILGLTEFAVRIPIALVGAISPVVLFFLVRLLTKNTVLAVISSVFLALSPWHITLSRATSEAVLAVLLAMVIMTCAFLLKERGKIVWAVLLYVCMVVSFISYHPINLFILLMIPLLILIYWRDLVGKKRTRALLIGVFLIYLIFPLMTGVFFSNAAGRLSQVVNIFGGDARKHLEVQLVEEGVGSNVYQSRMFHNKVVNATFDVGDRYLDYFSPKYLFLKGGLPNRYTTPDVGLINIVELLGLFLILISLFTVEKKKAFLFFLAWVIVGVIPAAITSDDHPNVSRAVLMMPALQVLAAYGLTQISVRKLQKPLLVGIFLVISAGVWHYAYFFHQYVVHERFTQWLDRSYPAKETVEKMSRLDRDKKILVSTSFLGTDIFVLFYEKVDPRIAQDAYAKQGKKLKKLYNYTFVDMECPSQKYPKGFDYFVEHYWCIEPEIFPVTPIVGADGRNMFKIVEVKE